MYILKIPSFQTEAIKLRASQKILEDIETRFWRSGGYKIIFWA